MLRWLLPLLLAGAASCAAGSPTPAAVLEGIVVDATSGRPIRGALVRVGGDATRAAPTDAHGRFRFHGDVPPGALRLRIDRVCYRTRTIELDTVPASPVRISLDRETAVVSGLDCSTRWPG